VKLITPQQKETAVDMKQILTIEAEPYTFEFVPAQCALLIIDMQRDFLEPGGFGEMLGNDVTQLRRAIKPNRKLLAAWRAAGLPVIHTREGHRPDLTDLPPAKKIRGRGKTTIGDPGPMGRILVRGEAGHDIIAELYPLPTEPVIDKPAKALSSRLICMQFCKTTASSSSSSPASPPKSVSTPPSAKPTIAAMIVSSPKIASGRISPSSRKWGSR